MQPPLSYTLFLLDSRYRYLLIICRFILDNKLATMYSSGSPEGGSDSSENRGEFLEKLQVEKPFL